MNSLNHVAIIMDGNGRWGLKHKNSRNLGHKQGLKTVEKIIQLSIKKKIKYLTLYVFSSENWKRPKKEVDYLFRLLENFLSSKIDILSKKGIKLKILGKIKFSKKLNKLLINSEKKTSNNKNIQVNLALNYGSKNEILDSIKLLRLKKLSFNEKNITNNLYTGGIPDPDILIRTGNTRRLSNFLLWQLSYSEIFFVQKLWPDFNNNDFSKIINQFHNIKRNFGSIQ